MKLAFCLYKYFPYGGLQRDFLRIAMICKSRGHQIQVFTLSWQGDRPEGFDIQVIAKKGISSPTRYRHFYREVKAELSANPVDVIVGFNKMPGLDIYYAADPCYAHKARYLRSAAYRLTSRYRHFTHYEEAVFGAGGPEILLISEQQKPLFQQFYGTGEERFHLLPPGIDKSRCAPDNAEEIRQGFRREFNLGEKDLLLLLIGSGFKTKGLDRILLAIKNLPEPFRSNVSLMVIGQDDPALFQREAKKLGIIDRVQFFSGRDDIPQFLQGADLLVHPAYSENTGTVILEALVAGLPVLATANCGYAHFVEESGGGCVAAEPYQANNFENLLLSLLQTLQTGTSSLRASALAWSKMADIYGLPQRASELIESLGTARRNQI